MKRFLAGLMSSILFLGLLVAAPAPAYAMKGCSSAVVDKADTWGKDVQYITSDGKLPDVHTLRLAATVVYVFCPNGERPWKVKPKTIDFCWSFIYNEEHITFEGVDFDANVYDKDASDSVLGFGVGDDGTIQNCKTWKIPYSHRQWLQRGQDPRWAVDYEVLRWGPIPNETGHFRWNEKGWKPFRPADDIKVSRWY